MDTIFVNPLCLGVFVASFFRFLIWGMSTLSFIDFEPHFGYTRIADNIIVLAFGWSQLLELFWGYL